MVFEKRRLSSKKSIVTKRSINQIEHYIMFLFYFTEYRLPNETERITLTEKSDKAIYLSLPTFVYADLISSLWFPESRTSDLILILKWRFHLFYICTES